MKVRIVNIKGKRNKIAEEIPELQVIKTGIENRRGRPGNHFS